MAATRKMQTEIERTLKKVQEGIEEFQALWEKMEEATFPAKKERFESELKKELKRLQRLRDQIRTWLSSQDVTALQGSLEAARKQIEAEMERFKQCEKASKIKAFSKEGLIQQPKLDPLEQAKVDAANFLNKALDSLQLHIDESEADLESISGAGTGGKKKAQPRVAELEALITQHKWHVTKLEQVYRLLENEEVTPEEVMSLRDSVDYYLEMHQDPDYMHDENMYDDVPFEKLDGKVGEELTAALQVATQAQLAKAPSLGNSPKPTTFTPEMLKEALIGGSDKGAQKTKGRGGPHPGKSPQSKDTPASASQKGGRSPAGPSPLILPSSAEDSSMDRLDLASPKHASSHAPGAGGKMSPSAGGGGGHRSAHTSSHPKDGPHSPSSSARSRSQKARAHGPHGLSSLQASPESVSSSLRGQGRSGSSGAGASSSLIITSFGGSGNLSGLSFATTATAATKDQQELQGQHPQAQPDSLGTRTLARASSMSLPVRRPLLSQIVKAQASGLLPGVDGDTSSTSVAASCEAQLTGEPDSLLPGLLTPDQAAAPIDGKEGGAFGGAESAESSVTSKIRQGGVDARPGRESAYQARREKEQAAVGGMPGGGGGRRGKGEACHKSDGGSVAFLRSISAIRDNAGSTPGSGRRPIPGAPSTAAPVSAHAEHGGALLSSPMEIAATVVSPDSVTPRAQGGPDSKAWDDYRDEPEILEEDWVAEMLQAERKRRTAGRTSQTQPTGELLEASPLLQGPATPSYGELDTLLDQISSYGAYTPSVISTPTMGPQDRTASGETGGETGGEVVGRTGSNPAAYKPAAYNPALGSTPANKLELLGIDPLAPHAAPGPLEAAAAAAAADAGAGAGAGAGAAITQLQLQHEMQASKGRSLTLTSGPATTHLSSDFSALSTLSTLSGDSLVLSAGPSEFLESTVTQETAQASGRGGARDGRPLAPSSSSPLLAPSTPSAGLEQPLDSTPFSRSFASLSAESAITVEQTQRPGDSDSVRQEGEGCAAQARARALPTRRKLNKELDQLALAGSSASAAQDLVLPDRIDDFDLGLLEDTRPPSSSLPTLGRPSSSSRQMLREVSEGRGSELAPGMEEQRARSDKVNEEGLESLIQRHQQLQSEDMQQQQQQQQQQRDESQAESQSQELKQLSQQPQQQQQQQHIKRDEKSSQYGPPSHPRSFFGASSSSLLPGGTPPPRQTRGAPSSLLYYPQQAGQPPQGHLLSQRLHPMQQTHQQFYPLEPHQHNLTPPPMPPPWSPFHWNQVGDPFQGQRHPLAAGGPSLPPPPQPWMGGPMAAPPGVRFDDEFGAEQREFAGESRARHQQLPPQHAGNQWPYEGEWMDFEQQQQQQQQQQHPLASSLPLPHNLRRPHHHLQQQQLQQGPYPPPQQGAQQRQGGAYPQTRPGPYDAMGSGSAFDTYAGKGAPGGGQPGVFPGSQPPPPALESSSASAQAPIQAPHRVVHSLHPPAHGDNFLGPPVGMSDRPGSGSGQESRGASRGEGRAENKEGEDETGSTAGSQSQGGSGSSTTSAADIAVAVAAGAGAGNGRQGRSASEVENALQAALGQKDFSGKDQGMVRYGSTTIRQKPCKTPASWPHKPIEPHHAAALFRKLGPDALFYSFYFQQSSYLQSLAAKELKKQDWRFNKHHKMWFQRHSAPHPRTVGSDHEKGDYVYFDFNLHELPDADDQKSKLGGWCQRLKKDFVFEYKYLDDDPLTRPKS